MEGGVRLENENIYSIEFNRQQFIEIMDDYANVMKQTPARFHIKEESYKGQNGDYYVKPSFYYEIYRNGFSNPEILNLCEDEIRGILSVVFHRFDVLDIEFNYGQDKQYHDPRSHIASSGPKPLTQEEMRICRHPEMYCYWEIKSRFDNTKVTFKQKEYGYPGEVLTEKVLSRKKLH